MSAAPRPDARTPQEVSANERLAPWLAAPLADFVREARVRLALVLEPSGRALAQHGFTRSLDVMTACALAAAIHASAKELGRELGETLGPLHHGGADRQLFLAPLSHGNPELLLLAVFERDTTLGIVRHFSTALAQRLARDGTRDTPRDVPRDVPRDGTPLLAADFERELARNLATLFGRA